LIIHHFPISLSIYRISDYENLSTDFLLEYHLSQPTLATVV